MTIVMYVRQLQQQLNDIYSFVEWKLPLIAV